MTNRSSKCHKCQQDAVKAVYFRDKNRVPKVAFYVCESCMDFSGFINWEKRRKVPYYDHFKGLIKVRLVKNLKDNPSDFLTRRNKVIEIGIERSRPCFVCKKYDYTKLYVRKKTTRKFVGYICKWCKTAYFIETPLLRLTTFIPIGYEKRKKIRGIPFNEYVGIHSADPEIVKEKYTDLHMHIQTSHLSKLRKIMKKHKINVLYSSDLELTPLKFTH